MAISRVQVDNNVSVVIEKFGLMNQGIIEELTMFTRDAAESIVRAEPVGRVAEAGANIPSLVPLAQSTRSKKTSVGYGPPDKPLMTTFSLEKGVTPLVKSFVVNIKKDRGEVTNNNPHAVLHEFGPIRRKTRKSIKGRRKPGKKKYTQLPKRPFMSMALGMTVRQHAKLIMKVNKRVGL